MKNNALNYSLLTGQFYYVNGRGQTKEIDEQNLIQMLLFWITKGVLPNPGESCEQTLTVKGQRHYKITLENLKTK